MDLTTIFGKYAGQPLLDPMRVSCDVDPVIEDMQLAATHVGLTVRMRWPDSHADQRYNMHRVNVPVEKRDDGRYYIAPHFTRG